MTRMMKGSAGALALLAMFTVPACGGDDVHSKTAKVAPTDDFSSLAEEVAKDDSFTSLRRVKLLGSLDYGQTSPAVSYSNPPKYRAYKFGGKKGDKVDIQVKSSDGDAVAWLLDNSLKTVAMNDDASDSDTDSHITALLPGNTNPDIITYYIVFREYSLRAATFTVSLNGSSPAPDFYSCNVDADCVKVPKVCCTNLGFTSVHSGMEQAYRDSLMCSDHLICPAILFPDDHSQAECNNSTHKCELVKPADISCGGFLRNSHRCPEDAGYQCLGATNPDLPGRCYASCGGIAARPCAGLEEKCVDNPYDSCDPYNGGADCGGLCLNNSQCVDGNKIYNNGDSWAKDCNTCSCSNGQVRCTLRACPAPDCRTTGCGTGQQCSFCWAHYSCIPDGALC